MLFFIGETFILTYEVKPNDASFKEVEWIIDDSEVVSLQESSGIVTGLKEGSTVITIKSVKSPSIFKVINVNVFGKQLLSDDLYIERTNITGGSPYVIGVEPKTTLTDFISSFDNNPSTVHVYDSSDKEITNLSTYTGSYMKVKLIVGDTTYDELTVVVRGDINGDGIVTISDKTSVKNIILGKAEKTFFNVLISDLNLDGNVTVSDSTANKNFILGKTSSLN